MGIGAPELARQLRVDPKDLRKYLRAHFPQPADGSRWDLSQTQVDRVRIAVNNGLISHGEPTERTGISRNLAVPRGLPLYAYKAFDANDLIRISQLRAHPEQITLQIGGRIIPFYPILKTVDVGRGRNDRAGYTGNGALLYYGGEKDGFEKVDWGTLDTNFYYSPGITDEVINTEDSNSIYGIRSPLGANVRRFYSKGYIQDLNRVDVPPFLVPIVLPQKALELDTPQLIVLNHYTKIFQDKLNLRSLFRLAIEISKPIEELHLTDIYSRSTKQTSINSDSFLSGHNNDNFEIGPISSYLATINLFKADPLESEEFRVTIQEIYRRFAIEPDIRATKLREEVANRFGFVRSTLYHQEGWVKPEPKTSYRERPAVRITDDLRVEIKGRFTCIVSGVSTNLPYEDEIVRRMICVGTKMREKISTISIEQRAYLERIFSGVDQSTE